MTPADDEVMGPSEWAAKAALPGADVSALFREAMRSAWVGALALCRSAAPDDVVEDDGNGSDDDESEEEDE